MGYGHPKFCSTVRQYLRDYRPDLVVFVEPCISGRRADSVIASLGFPYSHRVEAQGFSGGIWVAWFDSIRADIILNHFQFVHCRITDKRNDVSTLATIIYASPNATKHKALWSNIRLLAPSICSSWILFGDFNATICHSNRMGGSSMKSSKYFNDLVNDFGLRAVQHFICLKSDHRLILLQVGTTTPPSLSAPFRYLSGFAMVSGVWMRHFFGKKLLIIFTPYLQLMCNTMSASLLRASFQPCRTESLTILAMSPRLRKFTPL
ncbi:hypothetical protein V6N13_076818 [Hibiscus sabdariffa]